MNDEIRKVLFTIRKALRSGNKDLAMERLGIAAEILFAFGYNISAEYEPRRFTISGEGWKYEEYIS